jgi:acetyl coenzyme A synthetase (ADP forming)-like protein
MNSNENDSPNYERLRTIFNPSSIAVIGASRTPTKIGHETLKNVLVHNYEGEVYPVNPYAEEILGLKCYPSVKDIPGKIDLAVITVPAPVVPKIMRECAEKGVRGVIIITSGFGETGDQGKQIEQELLETARSAGIRILGPNTMGFKNASEGVDASFVFGMPYKGPIGLISQSGALCIAMIHHANHEKIGLSKVFGVGNKLDISDADLIEYLDRDPETKVIAMYIEGITDGRRFMRAAAECKKPIVAIKAGRTEAGARAASSHTGALAGADRIYDAAFRQTRIIRAGGINELFDYARALAYQPLPRGNRIGIVSNGAGAAILIADCCEDYGLEVPELSEGTLERLRDILPEIVTPGNPVDLVGDADFYRYEAASRALLYDENIDAVIITHVHAGYARPREYVGAVMKLVREQAHDEMLDKPIISCWIGGKEIEEVIEDLKAANIPVYPSTTRAVKAMAALVSARASYKGAVE